MIIGEARPEDAAAIARVHIDTWRTTYQGIVPDEYLAALSYESRTEAREQILRNPRPSTFEYVAEDESGQIVGFASGGPERSGDPAYPGELYAIYILQNQQGQGLGRQLVATVAARLIELDMPAMLLWVLAENPARRFYESLGGQVVRSQQIEIGGALLEEIAYGWSDVTVLLLSPNQVSFPPRRGAGWERRPRHRSREFVPFPLGEGQSPSSWGTGRGK